MRLLMVIVLMAAHLAAWNSFSGEDAPAKWPEISARFPADAVDKGQEVSPERLGLTFWTHPPEVVSPYEPSWYDYQPILWGEDPRVNGTAYFNALRKMYVRGGLCYSQHEPADLAESKMQFYCTNLCNMLYLRNKPGGKIRDAFKKDRTRENNVRNPSLEDPATDAAERGNAGKVAQRCASQKPLNYDLRDEATYTVSSASPHDFDFSAVSLASFRAWLRAKYGTLDALNAEWDAAFKTWDEVFPLMTDELLERLKTGTSKANLAPWADHREYNDDTFLAAAARYRDTIHTHDPLAPVGFSGTQMPSAYGGFDFWKIGRTIGWVEHYEICGSREILRSFLPHKYPSVAAIPYKSVDEGLRRIWYLILHGDSGALVWPYLDNDPVPEKRKWVCQLDVQKDGKVALTPLGENLKAIFREGRSGIPCLLRHAEPQLDPIGVLHSQASIRADWPFEVKRDGPTWINRYSSYEGSHNYAAAGREGVYKLIEDLGLQYASISSWQVEQGELLKRGIKFFVVPRGLALSDKEIAQLKAYVEQGGVLVTDLLAGRMDENSKVRAESPLDALLGLKRAPFAFEDEKKAEDDKSGGYAGGFGRKLEVTLREDFNGLKKDEKLEIQGYQEPGLAAGEGKPLGITSTGPALLEHAAGKGFAYTLNFDLPNYLALRSGSDTQKATATARRIFSALLEKAGVASSFKVSRAQEHEHPAGLEGFHFSLGAAEFVAVHPNGSTRIEIDLSNSGAGVGDQAGVDLAIQLLKKGFVTEMRSGQSFGQTDHVAMKLPKGGPIVLSVLPYEVKGVKADVGDGKIAGGVLKLSVAIDADGALGDHVVHTEFVDAGGEVVPESVVNLPLVKGAYKGAVDCSFVSGDGPWTLRLRDVASGKTAECKVSR
ncbi:MAG: beta-galactosidase [Planctomycetes bacterium]|nr:beta-galactosidase [Planctomycetota bacterium]